MEVVDKTGRLHQKGTRTADEQKRRRGHRRYRPFLSLSRLAIGGVLHSILAAGAMALSSLSVIGNSRRPSRF